MPTATASLRTKFFDSVFGETEGYICIATGDQKLGKTGFKQSFFLWPKQKEELAAFVAAAALSKNVWFCVNPLSKAERKKQHALPHDIVWADLDACHPSAVEPTPTIVINSSPNRYQAVWKLDGPVSPEIAEEYSKRIAYRYSPNGADPSGWDITQLLRVPFTTNYKYPDKPEVQLVEVKPEIWSPQAFEVLPPAEKVSEDDDAELPNLDRLPSVDQIIYKYDDRLRAKDFYPLYENVPDKEDDWSKILWRLLNICFEVGMTPDETFAVSLQAKCNKYVRDSRPARYLWRDVLKAKSTQVKIITASNEPDVLVMPTLLKQEELDGLPNTFLDDYREWGELATDAIPHYHELCGAILLSSTLASHLRLETSYGRMVPNLWGLVLGNSTLTRKTTAMRMATDLLMENDPDAIMATDGSAEGLLTSLSTRPGRCSVFFRDEVTGFLSSVARKDYMAGMLETLTQLYDSPSIYTRLLRKETITIRDPIFIFFGGGIRDKVYELLTEEHIYSGFLPRFLVVAGNADITRIRRTGPPMNEGHALRANLLKTLENAHTAYVQDAVMELAGQKVMVPRVTDVFLTNEAWKRYGNIEQFMVECADNSEWSLLALPTFERLSRSLLKLSCLLAAVRQQPAGNALGVDEVDIMQAAKYIQQWGMYSTEVVMNAGKNVSQRSLEKILAAIKANPGINRGTIMQRHHLTRREADDILGSLDDRGQITVVKQGKAQQLWAI
jgi:hypothetical protein